MKEQVKEQFRKNKKKIIVSILMIASLLFPPVRALLPLGELIPNDPVETKTIEK